MATINPLTPEQIEAKKAQGTTPLQTVGTAAPAGSGPSGTPMAQQQAGALQQQQRQGSGRFTNLQKYLSANQGAGQRIAGQIGQGLQEQSQKEAKEAQDYYSKLGQSVQQAQQVAQAGAGFQKQLQGIGQQIGAAQQAGFQARGAQEPALAGIESFVQSPDFAQFQNIQAGRGIDENLLAMQQQRAAMEAQQAAALSGQAQQQLGTEAGRFQLLRQAFGGAARPGYTQGQQRLDQILLGQGGGLGGLQAQAATQARADIAQARQAAAQAGEVGRIAALERGLLSDIGTQAQANEQAYLNMLKSYVDPLNLQRQEEFKQAEEKFKNLQASLAPQPAPSTAPLAAGMVSTQPFGGITPAAPAGPQFTAEELAVFGVTGPTRAYNVLPGLSFYDIATQGRQAQSAADVANQADVNRYTALARIAGISPESQQIRQASDLGFAFAGKEGEAGLGARLAEANRLFRERAADELVGTNLGQARTEGVLQAGARTDRGARAASTIQNLIEQGQAAVNPELFGSMAGANVDKMKRAAAADLWNQFLDELNKSGYKNVIGGTLQDNPDVAAAQRAANVYRT